MITTFSSSAKIAITPTTDVSSSVPFGLSGGMSAESSAEGDESFFIRAFYPAYTNFDSGGSAVDDSFTFGTFPGFEDNGTGGTAEKDWNGQALSIVTAKALVIEIKPIQAYLGTAATGVLTSDGTNVTDGDTVTIESIVYRFKNTMAAAYDIKIAATAALTILNLDAAIDASGTPGTEYYTGTLAHPSVLATGTTATTISFIYARTGDAGNLIATTEASTHLSWGAATLTGGEDVTQPAVARTLEGTVRIELGNGFLPGTSASLIYEVTSPSLLTLAIPEGWTPGGSGSILVSFTSDGPYPLTDKDVNAVVTVAIIGSST